MVRRHRVRAVGGAWIGRLRPVTVTALAILVAVLVVTLVRLGDQGGRSTVVAGPDASSAAQVPDAVPSDPPAEPPAGSAQTSPATGAAVPAGTLPAAPPTGPSSPEAAPAAPTPAAAPDAVTSYEAESPDNDLAGTRTFTCSGCSGGKKVGNIGRGMGILRFNGLTAATAGPAVLTLTYVNGEALRSAQLRVDGGAPVWLTFSGTGDWNTVGTVTVTVSLQTGANTLELSNSGGPAPDFDKITVRVPGR